MIPIEFQVHGNVHDGLVTNKSKGGVFIKSGQEFTVGDDIVVTNPFSKFGNKKGKGAVVRIADHGFAVKFEETS